MKTTYLLQPTTKPAVWVERHRWGDDNGLYYDTFSGEIFHLTDNKYVEYIGRLNLNQQKELEFV